MFLKTNQQVYEVSFGLKALILYHNYSNQLAGPERKRFLLYCGLITKHPQITFDEVNRIISQCDLTGLTEPPRISPYILQGLYTKAVGEMGIAPPDFYQMTQEEIEWAYEGYLRRLEVNANLTKTAIAEVLSNNNELIRLTEDQGYVIGTEEERENTFKLLGIE